MGRKKKIQHASITSSKPSNNNPNKTFFRQTEFIREWATAIILSSLVGKKKTAAAKEFHLFRRLLLHARKPYRPTSNLAHWKRNAHARAPTASPNVHAHLSLRARACSAPSVVYIHTYIQKCPLCPSRIYLLKKASHPPNFCAKISTLFRKLKGFIFSLAC